MHWKRLDKRASRSIEAGLFKSVKLEEVVGSFVYFKDQKKQFWLFFDLRIESGFCARICCGPHRGFEMHIQDNLQQVELQNLTWLKTVFLVDVLTCT